MAALCVLFQRHDEKVQVIVCNLVVFSIRDLGCALGGDMVMRRFRLGRLGVAGIWEKTLGSEGRRGEWYASDKRRSEMGGGDRGGSYRTW